MLIRIWREVNAEKLVVRALHPMVAGDRAQRDPR